MTPTPTRTEPAVVNIAAALSAEAKARPDALAVACPAWRIPFGRTRYVRRTFGELNRWSDVLARGLSAVGIGRGVRTALMVKPGLEFFGLTFALFKAGAVPVLIDPGMGVRNLGRCLAEAAPTAFIGVPRAQTARALLGWARPTLRISVTVANGSRWGSAAGPTSRPVGGKLLKRTLGDLELAGASHDPFPITPTVANETAAILFTSGSTGPPKGAVYTHGIFASQVAMLRDLYQIVPGEVDLCTFPLFALFAPALGMTSIVPRMDASRPARADPRKIIGAIREFGATNLFGSPALLKRVGEYGADRNVTLPSLKRVVSAGAPVPARVLERIATMLAPGVQIFTPYGATESLPIASIGSAEILGETRQETDRGAGVCVGRAAAGMRIEVIGISDEPITDWSDDLRSAVGAVGEIVVHGPVVTQEYFGRPEATRAAKIRAPEGCSPPLMHRMGDLGSLDEKGRLWFHGRKAHRVITGEETLFTIPCEAVFNTHPEVARTALVGIGPAGSARPVLCVEPRGWLLSNARRARMIRELKALGAEFRHTRTIQTFVFRRAFPVDSRHNAKIFREKLADWAARRVR